MSRTARRPLTLHVSALSDAEYSSFTSALGELTSPTQDNNWEDVTLSVREARGWIRGRYGSGVDGSVIDQILKNFSPDLAPQDILTGGQFFAVLRLVCHAQSGAPVDDSLVFVQANPEPGIPKDHTSRQSSPTKSAPPPPPRPSAETTSTSPTTPNLPPRIAPQVPSPNPFARSLSTRGHKRPHVDLQPVPNTEPDKYGSDPIVSSNPFRPQSQRPSSPNLKPTDPSVSSASSASSSASHTRQHALGSPPLPPRKPPATTALLPPPRHASLTTAPVQKPRGHISSSIPITSSKSYSLASSSLLPPPPKPPKPPQATSPLIKQSLQAAKGAQSVKELMDGLSKERRLEVIKKSGGAGSSGGQGGRTPGGSHSGEATPHRSVSPPPSLYDVASARIPRTASSTYSNGSDASSVKDADLGSHSPFHHPQLTHPATPMKPTPQFPFAHVITPTTPISTTPSPSSTSFPTPSPDHSPTHTAFATSSVARRSKSLHHPSPASTLSAPASYSPSHSPPLPPPRRRRPESVQVTSGSPKASPTDNGPAHTRRSSTSVFSSSPNSNTQHAGTSTSTSDSSVLETLHRTIATLRPGSGFESARVKAEGRVWPSGYVKGLAKGRGGREGEGGRLVGDLGGIDGDDEGDGGFGQDQEWDAGVDDEVDRGGRGRLREIERDELKMPVRPGEGWTALA